MYLKNYCNLVNLRNAETVVLRKKILNIKKKDLSPRFSVKCLIYGSYHH